MTSYAYTRALPSGVVKTVGGFRNRRDAAWAAHRSAVDNGYERRDLRGGQVTSALLAEPYRHECSGVTYTTHKED